MNLLSDRASLRSTALTRISLGTALALASIVPLAARAESPADQPETGPAAQTYQTLHLSYLTQDHEADYALTDLRNMLPHARIYYVPPQHAISIRGTKEEIALAQEILGEIDQPRKTYRLTYTITDIDNGKRSGSESYTLVVVPGEKTSFRQGSKVPIVTGDFLPDKSNEPTQVFQYEDVGLKIEASLEGARLHTRVEQSSIAGEKSSFGAQDPVIHETDLDGMSTLEQGKPMVLGSLDLPGTGRRRQIEVVAEAIP
jgi:type II secretory pathway component GspD/PulD (secretin)